MKAKHIITTCGVILGGLAVAGSASAVVTYQDSSFVQFTFAPSLSMTLSSNALTIPVLAPGTDGTSNVVTASVETNSGAGYLLTAKIGGATSSLSGSGSAAGSTIDMIASGASALSSGTWGLTIDGGATYKSLSTSTDTPIAESNTLASDTTPVQIGAYAAAGQAAGTYTNTINFAVTSKVSTYTITAATGTGAATATIAGGTSTTLTPGSTAALAATCASGTFSRWEVSGVGSVASETSASTTFTAGNGPATVTAYCN